MLYSCEAICKKMDIGANHLDKSSRKILNNRCRIQITATKNGTKSALRGEGGLPASMLKGMTGTDGTVDAPITIKSGRRAEPIIATVTMGFSSLPICILTRKQRWLIFPGEETYGRRCLSDQNCVQTSVFSYLKSFPTRCDGSQRLCG